ncbi:hypothetical protein A4H97_31195 [Niastella yeongjuensis]|uniref:DUF5977 domain-containing protein n=1 Tax=Niastella yeongjuensis TaxID=354355 RepID=A0A1V9EJC4_9BACT|nr:DUF5977 domain-containing protein [Niastella yeongjuensis]OQP46230.1 hypothetical protein A4H97_31195 [Niastella yeongjuensis]SEP46008.1 YD repeat-containing protein [Niastella yeongjuensis]
MLNATRRFPFIFYPLLIFAITKAVGQASYIMPTVIQPSPQSLAFTRYGDYPMSDYAGLTNITIPLHTVTGRKLSMPITISFHASGRMADEMNGTLGMRWTLNCGGLVTRTMKGAPDEWNFLTPHEFYTNSTPSFEELYSACPDGKIPYVMTPAQTYAPTYDSEFDLFSYALPNGKQGHFILKNVNGVKVPMIIPFESLKIELHRGGDKGFYESIDITDVDGTKYVFGKVDASSVNAVETSEDWDGYEGRIGSFPTGWYLTKVISSDGTDEISLSYITKNADIRYSAQTANILDQLRDGSSTSALSRDNEGLDDYADDLRSLIVTYHFELNDPVSNSKTYSTTVPTVSGIQFYGGSVAFNYAYGGAYDRWLTDMTVNKGATPYKKVKFTTTKHAGEAELAYLDNLSFYGEDPNLVNEQYNFSYYEPGLNTPQTYGRQASVIMKDWWGYFSSGVYNLLPYRSEYVSPTISMGGDPIFKTVGFSNINRDGDEESKKLGMLRTIKYPTGGETEFVYEGNQYDFTPYYTPITNPAILQGPGLRIKEVISKPGNGGKNIHKIYKYGTYEDGRGYLNSNLHPEKASYLKLLMTTGNVARFWQAYYTDNTREYAGYRTRDYFADPYVHFDFSDGVVKYDAVNEYYLEDEIPKQKTTSSYGWDTGDDWLGDFIVNDHQNYFEPRKFSNPAYAWSKPELRNKAFYKYTKTINGNDQYDLIKQESNEYGSWAFDEAWDMPTYLHTNVMWARTDGIGAPTKTDNYVAARDYHNYDCSVYGYGFRNYRTGNQLLLHSVIEEYTPNGVIKTEKTFDYDHTNSLLKSEEGVNSKNELVKTVYKYPFDLTSVPVYNTMNGRNIISPVIEATTTVNGVQTKKTVTNYYNPASNVFVPQSVENQTGNNPQEVTATFNRYDNMGHILEQQKANNVKEIYLWGYQSRYPVAKILNTTYDIANSYISQSVLDGATGNGDDAALRTHLNNLRNIPGALVETYTYKPFVGMTGSTDANGRTTYYEYDGFGRLIHLRDKDNNIVKKYCYNYAGQTESCPLSGNSAESGTFIRSGCTTGNAGTPVTYTVPANTYFGPNADALAQNDVNANGQAYADKNGTCVIASYNVAKSQPFTKNNCIEGGFGSSVTYSVPANKYAAYNLDAANQMAQDEINANGQNYANANGYCTWYNDEMGKPFTKNDCEPGYTGTTYTYTIPERKYSSTVSKAAANQLAQDDINENGQWQANSWGSCEDRNAYLTFQNQGERDCDIILYNYEKEESYYLNVPRGYEVQFVVPAGTFDVTFLPNDSGSSSHFYSVAGTTGSGYGSITFSGIYFTEGPSGNFIAFD